MPTLPSYVSPEELAVRPRIRSRDEVDEWSEMSGAKDLWEDYVVGERIDRPLGMTIEEADHMSATRLYQNNSLPHFDGLAMKKAAVGRRLVYGGHVISTCRALAYDGLENAVSRMAINGGRHVSPATAGDTLYAFSEVTINGSCPAEATLLHFAFA